MSQEKEINNYSDNLSELPFDDSDNSKHDIDIIDSIFTKNQSTLSKLIKSSYNTITIGILFIIFSLPLVDKLFHKFIKVTSTSEIILIGVKSVFVMIFYLIIHNIWIVRKNN